MLPGPWVSDGMASQGLWLTESRGLLGSGSMKGLSFRSPFPTEAQELMRIKGVDPLLVDRQMTRLQFRASCEGKGPPDALTIPAHATVTPGRRLGVLEMQTLPKVILTHDILLVVLRGASSAPGYPC